MTGAPPTPAQRLTGPPVASGEADADDFVLGVEHRYPLRLAPSRPELAAIYRAACRDVWDPETTVDVPALSALDADDAALTAAAAAWRWAAWVEYTAITESDALLVRFCIEDGREAELKYLLTSRGQGRALAAEACTLVAGALEACRESGRRKASRAQAADAGVLRRLATDAPIGRPADAAALRRLARAAGPRPSATVHASASPRAATVRLLHADVPADALVCARLVIAEAVDIAAWEVAAAHASPGALRAVIDRLLVDRRRMLQFGLAYAQLRLPRLDHEGLDAVAAALPGLVAEERPGARCPALRPAAEMHLAAADMNQAAADMNQAAGAERAAAAGLGVAPAHQVRPAIAAAIDAALAEINLLLRPQGGDRP